MSLPKLWSKETESVRLRIPTEHDKILADNRKAKKDGRRRLVFINSMSDFFEADRPLFQKVKRPTAQPGELQFESLSVATCDDCGYVGTGTGDSEPHYYSPGRPCYGELRPYMLSDQRREAFETFAKCEHLAFMLLTKRPENIHDMWPERAAGVSRRLANVWIGTTVENQIQANRRIPLLAKCRQLSPCLFLSCEPLLGMVHFQTAMDQWERSIDWVISGGESGFHSRVESSIPENHRMIRDQCRAVRVPYHFKQHGAWVCEDQLPHLLFQYAGKMEPIRPDDLKAMPMKELGGAKYHRIGKAVSGRKLDGVEHNGWPVAAGRDESPTPLPGRLF